MENQESVIKIVLKLLDTIEEALDYIENNQQKRDIAKILLNDVITAFSSIYISINEMKEEFPFNQIDEYNSMLIESINNTLRAEEYILDNIQNMYLCYKQEIKRCLEPYILC